MRKLIAVIFCILTYIQCVKFGEDNSYTCHCNNDEQCNEVNGKCDGGCAKGWSGVSCQKQNVALGKPTSQVDFKVGREPGLAVDGDRTTNIPDKCSYTYHDGTIIWWRVDLQEDYPIKHITIYYRSEPNWSLGSLNGFSLHINKENKERELCYKDNTNSREAIRNIECSQVITGRYVNISNFHPSPDARFLVLCEVEIFVCSVGTFGSDCNKFCHCLNNERCSETGQCPGRCADGWTGTTCSQKCTKGLYGNGCKKKCSNRKCLNNSPCDHVRGECIGGCSDGYILPDCSKACDNDMYGAGCSKICSERNCLVEIIPCNHINGSCQYGCKEGFTGIDCVKRCKEGVYGAGCSKKCSDRKCKDSNLQCASKTGECIDGCQPGYKSIDCIQECNNGTYGPYCQFKCSARFCQSQDKDNCSNIDGACDCLEGYHGIDCVAKQEAANPGCTDKSSTLIGTILGIIFGFVAGALVVLFIMKRRSMSQANLKLTSNQPSSNVPQPESTSNQPVTQPSSNISNNQDNPYDQLTTTYQNENAYEHLEKTVT